MFIYNGTLNLKDSTSAYASNEAITVVFPDGLELNHPVSAFWQWSKVPAQVDGDKASAYSSLIHRINSTPQGDRIIYFSLCLYSFKGTFSHNFKKLSLKFIGPTAPGLDHQSIDPIDLTVMHTTISKNSRSVIVYMGHFKWSPYAENEMMTIVTPYGVTESAFFGLCFRWKPPCPEPGQETPPYKIIAIKGTFREVTVDPSSGRITATYTEPNETPSYKYKFEFDSDSKKGSLVMSSVSKPEDKSEDNKFVAAYTV